MLSLWTKFKQYFKLKRLVVACVIYVLGIITTLFVTDIWDYGKRIFVNDKPETYVFLFGQEKSYSVNELLSKGKIGEINAQLLGMIIVSQIYNGAMARERMSKKERKDFFLYVDEFQNFVSGTFADILSEARKYRLALIMAHQYIAQLEAGK